MNEIRPSHRLALSLLSGRFAVCRLDPGSQIPNWASASDFFSITRTRDELSVVCPEESVPDAVRSERGWKALRVLGSQDFSLVGVLASLVEPLARAEISLFAVSTFDTDYLLIKGENLERAVAVLIASGHRLGSEIA